MPWFNFTAQVTVSARTAVWAGTEDEAKAIAEGRAVVLGGSQIGENPHEIWVIEEADGELENINLIG